VYRRNKNIKEVFSMYQRVFNFFFYTLLMHFILVCTSILPNSKQSNRIRGFLLKPFFKSCGRNLQVASGVKLINSRKIDLGNDVYIAHNVWINGSGGLNIESGVIISPMVVIATTKHAFEHGRVSNTKSELSPIVIGEGSWIASNSVVTKGVSIGKGCVIGACSSVTRSIPNYTLAGGVPAKVIKKIQVEDY
jgi:acetyltransferase-like isoleucine patch superfamily enzyme